MSDIKKRGRPTAKASTQVYQALLDAAETCLKDKPYRAVTVREIADEADTNPAMINYYFKNKEGLFIALVEFLFSEWDKCISEIIAQLPSMTELPTHPFVQALDHCFYAHTPILRLLTTELSVQESGIQSVYHERLASRSSQAISRFINAAQIQGFYKRETDLNYIVFSIATLCTHPTSIRPNIMKLAYNMDTDNLRSNTWLNHLETNINRLLS